MVKGCEVCSREVCWNLLRELEPCLFWDWFADVHIGEEWIEEGGRLGEIHGQPLFDPLPEERMLGMVWIECEIW